MNKVAIADDHPLFREAVKSIVAEFYPDYAFFEAANLQEAIQLVDENPEMDLMLLDLNMPGMNGLTGIVEMRNAAPDVPIGIISAEQDKDIVLKTISYGSTGFIAKSSSRDTIAMAIRHMLNGQIYLPVDIMRDGHSQVSSRKNKQTNEIDLKNLDYLTRKQLQVFEQMVKGGSNKQISAELNIAETTVKAHVSAILQKLKVKNRIQAVLCASSIDFDQYLRKYR
jgi:DNA-binding NarL/FixJ family response regulator